MTAPCAWDREVDSASIQSAVAPDTSGLCRRTPKAALGALQKLLDMHATVHGDAARFHNHVIVDEGIGSTPRSHLLNGPPESNC